MTKPAVPQSVPTVFTQLGSGEAECENQEGGHHNLAGHESLGVRDFLDQIQVCVSLRWTLIYALIPSISLSLCLSGPGQAI